MCITEHTQPPWSLTCVLLRVALEVDIDVVDAPVITWDPGVVEPVPPSNGGQGALDTLIHAAGRNQAVRWLTMYIFEPLLPPALTI
jgi:hypothetical protein